MRWSSLCFALLLAAACSSASNSVAITTTETGKITSYFNQFWVVNVDGNITFTNPTDRDLYSISVRYDLVGLSLIETSNTSYFHDGQILISRMPANTTITASYTIVGIALTDPALIGKGILYSGLTKFVPVVYSDSFGQLQKASLEDASITGRPGRLISVTLRNPTGFQFTVQSLKVIKTPDLDPNNVLDEWQLINDSAPFTVDPDAFFVRDILDKNSAEGQVYWLSVDVFISRVNFYDYSNVTRYTQMNLTVPPELLNYTINATNETNKTVLSELFVKKLADRQVVTVDEPVTLSFIVNNFAQKLIPFTITDVLPPGFSFKDGDGWTERNGKILYTNSANAKNALVASYTAQLTDAETAGLDYFDAAQTNYTVDAVQKIVYSETVPFVRQFVPGQRLYVQKKLSYETADQVSVTLTIQNLGASPVHDLLLKEYLSDTDVFSEITQIPSEKGLWDIKEIKTGDVWEVSYLTTKDTPVTILPGVYGIPARDVMKSLVLETVVLTAWETVQTAALEIVGIGLLLTLPIAYYVMRKRRETKII